MGLMRRVLMAMTVIIIILLIILAWNVVEIRKFKGIADGEYISLQECNARNRELVVQEMNVGIGVGNGSRS